MSAPSQRKILVCVAILCVVWGSTWLVIKQGLRDLPPFGSAGVRFLIAGLVMTAVSPFLAKREGGSKPAAWLWLTLGISNFGLSVGIIYVGSQVLPSGLVSVLFAIYPLLMALSGHLFLNERLTARHSVGFLIGLIGVGVLFSHDLFSTHDQALTMALLLLISPVATAISTTLVKKYGGETSAVLLNRNAMFAGAAVLLCVAALFEQDQSFELTPYAVFSVLYLAVVGTCVTFTLLFWLMRYASAAKLSTIAYVTPVIAVTLGALLGGEPLTPSILIGTALVIGGVVLATWKRRVRRVPDPA